MNKAYAAWAARRRVALGFGLGAAYLVLCQPSPRLLAVGGGVALTGVLLRAWAAGCLEKNQSLATGGPYALTRNPLYLGSFLIGAGFAIAGGSWIVGLAFVVFFLLIYWPVMHREEESLRTQFGEDYHRYAEQVPLFFPTGKHFGGVKGSFRLGQYRKNREYQAALGFAAGLIFLALKMSLK